MPAFYIVLQQKISGVDATGLEGRALSKFSDKLEALAEQAGAKPLLSFFSATAADVMGLLDDDEAGKPRIPIPEEQWFQAEEGLKTIAALLQSLADTPQPEGSRLTAELTEFQRVLQTAQARNIRWHLAIDY
jgi:hypothetical protein